LQFALLNFHLPPSLFPVIVSPLHPGFSQSPTTSPAKSTAMPSAKPAKKDPKGPTPGQTGLPETPGPEKTGGQLILERAKNSAVPESEADRIIRSKGGEKRGG
jgi:hypothetical protein